MRIDLITEIENRRNDMSRGQKRIADFILENYQQAAYMTTVQLGMAADVSESTVVRFAHAMGYQGYPEFQQAFLEVVKNKLTAVQRMEVTNRLIGDGDVLCKVLASDMQKIKRTLEETKRESFNRVVDMLIRARNIYIIGVRSSNVLAQFLSLNLRMILDSVHPIDASSSGELFEQIMDMGRDDVLFAISFPRYSARVVRAVKFAQRSGATVVSLTDNPSSPIARGADEVLYAYSDMASYVDSLVAPLSLLDAILVAITKKCPEQAAQHLNRLEQLWDEYEVYDKNKS